MPYLSIITPTYNRAHTLTRCFDTLRVQTSHDFEWIIVDDGSTDCTAETVKGFTLSCPEMDIRYIYKENGGKHTALNAAHKYLNGHCVTVLDSDDYFTEEAVESIISAWQEFGSDPRVGIIYFQKGFDKQSPICYVREDRRPVNTLKCKRISNGQGRDCCDTYRTDLFIKHPFPVFEGEKFIGEGAAFFHIESECLGVYINNVIYICNYYDDGLTKAGRRMRIMNPRGGRYNSLVYMSKLNPLATRLRKAVLYVCYNRFTGDSIKSLFSDTQYKLLCAVCLLPGIALYKHWKKRYSMEVE